jgi:hypothetical protein
MIHWKTSSCTSDTKGKGGTTPDVRVVTFAEKLHYPRNLSRILEQKEG